MADKNQTETATTDAGTGVLDNAVQKVKDQREETVPYNVTSESPLPGARREVVFEVANEEYQKRLEKVFKDVKNNAAVEGFRRGKAPMALLQRRYQQEAATQVVEDISTQVMRDYVTSKNLQTWGSPTISEFSTEQGKPISVHVIIEVNPDIDIQNYKGIEVDVPGVPVLDEYVDARIDDLLQKSGTYEPTDEAVAEGFEVTANYKITDKRGNTVENKQDEVIGAQEIAYGPFQQLLGMKAGEAFEIKDGKNTIVGEIRVVRKFSVPELNDDFAVDLGLKNLEELRNRERTRIEGQAKEIQENNAFDAILTKLVEANDFEVPPTLQEQTRRDIARADYTHYQRTGMLPSRLSNLDSRDQYLQEVDKAAHSRVKSYLLMQAIAAKESLEATEEDINAELERMATEHGRKALAVRASLERQRQWEEFTEQVRLNKIRQFMLANSKVNYTEPVEDKPESEEAEATSETPEKKPKAAKKKKAAEEHSEQEETKES